ncbi:MAG TPA: polymer-forming cytoskeletal protein [Rhodanobacter sp.]|nr:polymer-forming cytoskeletal protein [Rhodanobacter sp.]
MLNRKRRERHQASDDTSLIARGTVIRGDLCFRGALHLDGRVEGTIVGEGEDAMFTLSEHGQVDGEIRVPHAILNGHVTGDVQVTARLELSAQARIDGNLRYHTLEMAAGAQINGNISREGDSDDARRELPAPAETEEAVSA